MWTFSFTLDALEARHIVFKFFFLVMNQNITIKNILREIIQVLPATSEDNEKMFKEEINLQFSGHYN